MKKIFKIEVDCAVCANKIEEGVKKVEGVTSCNVNFMTQKMTLEASDEEFDKVLKKVIKVAKKIEPDFEIEA
ncbi:MAG: cation transporter [Anaeroplasmataceae bacterium]|nr:cation transporter [Anaeroplasmataceae bacterium]MDE7100800.1 cation transporter [Anaeroplasmataceae bacterium]